MVRARRKGRVTPVDHEDDDSGEREVHAGFDYNAAGIQTQVGAVAVSV